MSWFTNLEKSIAGKLTAVFTDAKKLAEAAGDEVLAAEAALEAAHQKAADLSRAAHEAALAAVAKAQAETAKLLEEAKAAEANALFHAKKIIEPAVPTLKTQDTETPATPE